MSDKKKPDPQDKSKTLAVKDQSDKSRDELMAEMATGGIITNAGLITNFSKDYLGEIGLTECAEALVKKAVTVQSGNMKDAETLLMAQAVALDSIFSALASRSRTNMGEYMNAAEKYMRLALKAQGQCRATLETLAAIKNPQPYIQNNKAQYQQVNNGVVPSEGNNQTNTRTHAHAGKNLNNTNGLLEDKIHEQEWLDTGAPETAGAND